MVYSVSNMNDNKKKSNWDKILEVSLTLLVNALVLIMASMIFNNFYIESFMYAVITASVIMILNILIKPIIKVLTLPLTIFTLGLSYPIVNVIILKLAGVIMGDKFIVEGWFVPFFIAIFISIMTIVLDLVITKQIVGGRK